MLRHRYSSERRLVKWPLVWVAAAAIATSASPVAAQTFAAPSTSAATTAPPTPPPPPPAPNDDGVALRTVGYIAGAVGIAGFVLFAVAGIGAKNAHDRLDEACAAGRCNDASHEADIADGKRLQTAANIGLATGLAGLGLGATFVVLGSHSTSDSTPAVGSAPSGGMFTFSGRF